MHLSNSAIKKIREAYKKSGEGDRKEAINHLIKDLHNYNKWPFPTLRVAVFPLLEAHAVTELPTMIEENIITFEVDGEWLR